MGPSPLQTDKWIYRIIVGSMAVSLMLIVGGGVALSLWGKEIPAAITVLGGSALSGMVALLVPSPSRGGGAGVVQGG